MKVKLSIRLTDENGEKAFGPGIAQLLRLVESTGSLNQAAKAMELSYSKAWKILRNAEHLLGVSFLERTIGGAHGGGSQLTQEGRQFLEQYEAYREKMCQQAEELFEKMFSKKL